MAIRTFEYTVTENSITPSSIVQGGIQGEHNATELKFNINSSLKTILAGMKKTGRTFYYRFDCFSGVGIMKSTEPKSFDPSTTTGFSHLIEEWQTRYGGTIQVYFVITLTEAGSTNTELYSYGVKILLRSLPEGGGTQSANYESVATLLEAAKKEAQEAADGANEAEAAKNTALEAANTAVAAKEQAEAAKGFIESGAEWIFDGGDASGAVEIKTVDVVGNVFITSSPNINPADLFGGTWQLIDKGYANVSGNDEPVRGAAAPLTYFTLPEDGKTTACTTYFSRSGSTVRLRLAITSEETFTDSGGYLGKINFEKLGFKSLPFGYNYILATTDYANGGLMISINWETGDVNALEIIGSDSISSYYQDKYYPYYADITFVVTPNRMLDDFCDKFYWKRTG